MSDKSNSSSGYTGPGFATLLTLLFITLKLLGKISWPWCWVLSPIWISAAFAITVLIFVFIVILITTSR